MHTHTPFSLYLLCIHIQYMCLSVSLSLSVSLYSLIHSLTHLTYSFSLSPSFPYRNVPCLHLKRMLLLKVPEVGVSLLPRLRPLEWHLPRDPPVNLSSQHLRRVPPRPLKGVWPAALLPAATQVRASTHACMYTCRCLYYWNVPGDFYFLLLFSQKNIILFFAKNNDFIHLLLLILACN